MSKIIGNTTATPNPRPDWAQTDAAKADYIKNKELVTDAIDGRAYKTTLSIDDTATYTKTIPKNSANYAQIKTICGMTRKCTNLLTYPYTNRTLTVNGVTFTDNGDGSITINGTAEADLLYRLLPAGTRFSDLGIADGETLTYSAKYIGNSSNGFSISSGSTIAVSKDGFVTFTADGSATFSLRIWVRSGTTITNETIYPMLNRGSEVLPFEPYFEGLRSAPVTEVESVGVNIWDEQWKIGTYNNNPMVMSKNKIPVQPNTKYYFKSPVAPANGIWFYDASLKAISSSTVYPAANSSFTTPDRAYYMEFRMSTTYGETYNNDICISISNAETKGKYFPYIHNTLPIPEAVQALDGYGWGISNTVYNYIDFEKKQFVKRVGYKVIDNVRKAEYEYANVQFYAVYKPTDFIGYQYTSNSYIVPHFTQFEGDWGNATHIGQTTGKATYSSLWFGFPVGTTIEEAKATLIGLPLYYELAEPIITDISDILSVDNYIEVEGGGTLTFINESNYDVPNSVDYYIGNNEYLAADKFIGTAIKAEADAEGNNIVNTYATKDGLDELDDRTECLKDTEGDNKILRSYQGKWYAVYPSLFAPQQTWYKGTTDKATITEINIVDTYTSTSSETEMWNADVDNMGYIKCYVSGTVLTIAGNGYGKLSCHMDSLGMFMNFTKVTAINGASLLDTSSVVNMKDMFRGCNALTTLDVSNWDVGNVIYMNQAFVDNYELATLNVSNWDVSNVTTMKNTFNACKALTTLDVSNWNTSNVTDMISMFYNCHNLAELDVSNWDTGKVTTMKQMFALCNNLTSLDVSNWDVSNVTIMTNMFRGCSTLTTLNVSNWDTGNVTSLGSMFLGCTNLTMLDVSNWDVGNVTDMTGMFNTSSSHNAGDGKLVVDVSKWNPKSLEGADSMFYGNAVMTSIDLRNWNISKLKTMSHMFADCHNLAEIKLDGLVASSCISFNGMFNDCKSLVSIDLTGFVTDAAEEFQQMFEGCTALTEIKGLNTFVTTNAKAYHEMFYNASSLTELDLSSFRTEKLTTGIAYSRTGEENRYYPMTNMFTGMNKLQRVTFGDSFEFIEENYLPAPSADYIEGATGLWKNESTGVTYAPADVPTKTAATYVAA